MAGHGKQNWPRLGTGSCPTEDQDTGLGHIVSKEVYWAVYISLVALTGITVRVAYLPFSDMVHLMVALGIATIKAAVVTFLFMHLLYESKIIWGIVIYPIFIFLLIVAGTLGDASVKHKAFPRSLASASSPKRAISETNVEHGSNRGGDASGDKQVDQHTH